MKNESLRLAVESLNNALGRDQYAISNNGRVYMEFLGKKTYFSSEIIIRSANEGKARRNAKKVCVFIESNGGVLVASSSKAGSYYDSYKGKKVRVSDHPWTSQFHSSPEVNLCSYDDNGHIEMIEQLNYIN